MPTNGQFQDLATLAASDINTLLTRGYSNRIINGAFVINQRGYTSGTNLASGAYGLDRWKSGFTNTALTFTAGSQSTTVTISTSGVLQQIIERENMPAGTYTLSWTGTATGRVYNVGGTAPTYAASPIIVSLDGLADVIVEFTASGGSRTLSLVQLEGGNVFSPFEYRHRQQELALCRRYYIRITDGFGLVGSGFARTTTEFRCAVAIEPMRAVPTFSFNNVSINLGASNFAVTGVSIFGGGPTSGLYIALAHTTLSTVGQGGIARVSNAAGDFFEINAEL